MNVPWLEENVTRVVGDVKLAMWGRHVMGSDDRGSGGWFGALGLSPGGVGPDPWVMAHVRPRKKKGKLVQITGLVWTALLNWDKNG
jgi:hypothetical protein